MIGSRMRNAHLAIPWSWLRLK